MNNFHQMFGSSVRQLQFRPPFRDPELYQSICYLGVMARSRKKSHRGKLGEQMLYCKGRHQNWCDVRPCHGSGRMGDVFNNSLFKQAGFTPQFNWKLGRTLSPLIHQLCFFHDSVITTLPSNTHGYSLKCFHSTSLLQSPKPRNKSNSHRKNKYKSSSKNKTMKHSKGKEHHHNHPLRLRTGIPDPIEEQQKSTPKEIPPAYLTRTASPFVYISKCAVMDEQTGEVHFNPMALYSDLYPNSSISTSTGQSTSLKKLKRNSQNKRHHPKTLPSTFRLSHFHYFPPSSFPNYEPPTDGTPEIAFLGRSNTGKSSLINALASTILRSGGGPAKHISSGGGELARTSKRPGRTQTINYFGLIPNSLMSSTTTSVVHLSSFKNTEKLGKHPDPRRSGMFLVDLPGFGYASAPDESVDEWQAKTQQFLISRASFPVMGAEEEGENGDEMQKKKKSRLQPWPKQSSGGDTDGNSYFDKIHNPTINKNTNAPPLKKLYLLLDSRLPQPTPIDLTVMGWCDDYSIPYTLVLTKVDGSSRAHCVRLTNQLCMRYHSLIHAGEGQVSMDPLVYWTSAKDGLGMEELLGSLEGDLVSGEEEDIVVDEYDDYVGYDDEEVDTHGGGDDGDDDDDSDHYWEDRGSNVGDYEYDGDDGSN
mmetsp:Transcript_10623/g.22212  ORF Transcript_10623/g.22212 Transcript_10623/m.22212 type:complete len:645 (+) Transcript_10623:142-2076(+)